jgi:hypothetical protein
MYFPPAFFNISVYFITYFIKEIKLLVPVFLHQMYVYERFNGILKSFVRNRAYLEGSTVQEYCTEEVVEWVLNYIDQSNPIGVSKSRHQGNLTGKGTIGRKAITPDPNLFRCSHFHVLQQISIMSEYLDEHKEVLLRDNPIRNESWLANEHMRKFTGWLRDQNSQSSDTTQTSEYLKKLAHGPIFTVVTYQGYDIIGYMYYTEQQDKKNMYQNSGVHIDTYDVTGQDKTCTIVKYKRSGSLTFIVSRFIFFVAKGLMQSRVL